MRVVIELKRGEVPEVVLNNLYKQTQLQDTFGMNMVALVDGQPRCAQPQADARVLPGAPARGGHPAHGLRAAQGARARPHPGRPGGRAGQRRRNHRPDQGAPTPPTCQGAADGARLGRRSRWRDAARAALGCDAYRPEGLEAQYGLSPRRLPPVRSAGQAILECACSA
jgi:DNA gyrase subunit A